MDIHHSHAKYMGGLTALADGATAKMHVMLSRNLLGNTSGLVTEPTVVSPLVPVFNLNAFMSISIMLPRPLAMYETHIC